MSQPGPRRPSRDIRRSWARPWVAAGLALTVAVGLASCSDGADSISSQAKQGSGKGYVAGDGTIEQIAPADRTTSIAVSGTTLDGASLDTTDWRGKVVVINTWGSWCPPCNAEAPDLQKTWESLQDADVEFVGVDLRDSPETGLAFQRKFGLTYPSLRWDGGSVLLQMKGKATATPTTLVLDRSGRLAGRISGRADASTLKGLVESALGESA
ncbi:MAG TPA: TlpA disulfide reductase family protein [Actinomycetales bacterium]|nr:TlpA disulfide reductase family protein [Actinomycetales bacterium]